MESESAVEVPTIDMIQTETGIQVDEVNQQIYDLCRQYADEYRKAFLDTGGPEEEWEAHKIQINVGYEIKSQTDQYLSFIVRGRESWTTAYSESRYYNIDVNTGKRVTLADFFGKDYVEAVNTDIREQIAQRKEAGVGFLEQEEVKADFPEITEECKILCQTKPEIPDIAFEKYEIAPGSSGEIEFEIQP